MKDKKKSGFFKNFRDFISRGNVVDLAVAVVIGRAFGDIVSSFVSDILMPPVGFIIQGVDFSKLALTLKDKVIVGEPVVTIKYGAFLNTVIDFIIISFAIFLFVGLIGRIRRLKEEEPTNGECPECLMSIPKQARKCGHCGSNLSRES